MKLGYITRITTLTLALLSAATAFAGEPLVIMPLGDSITNGIDFTTNASGGYRDPLYTKLINNGITPQFIGTLKTKATATLTNSGNQYHNGFNGYRIGWITENLDGDVTHADGNQGGYWITGGHDTGRAAVSPDIVLLAIGGNDVLAGKSVTQMNADIQSLVTTLHGLTPTTKVLVGGATPRAGTYAGSNAKISEYNDYIKNTLVSSLPYAEYVDLYSAFLKGDGSVNASYIGTDGVHPTASGYGAMAGVWASAVEQAAVPEPASAMLIGSAFLAWVARRQR